MLAESRSSYQAYLLRLWKVETAAGLAWRALLEDVHSGEQQRFSDLEMLLAYLRDEACGDVPANDPSNR